MEEEVSFSHLHKGILYGLVITLPCETALPHPTHTVMQHPVNLESYSLSCYSISIMIFILALHISTIPNISYIIFKKFWVIIE